MNATDAGFPRELLTRPVRSRLDYFRSYTIAHPLLVEADAALRLAIEEPGGASLVLICGPTGVGKTTLRLRAEQRLKQSFLPVAETEAGRIPVLSLEAVAPEGGSFSWLSYYRRALHAMAEPLVEHKLDYGARDPDSSLPASSRANGHQLRFALEQALRYRRPAAVLIDEAQHLTKIASGRKLQDQLDSLKSLAGMTGCVHVLFGTYELLPFRNLSAQLSRRSLDLHLRRYGAEQLAAATAFQRVIFSFQRHLPLTQEPDLCRQWEYLYARSVGCVGVLTDWLSRALAAALEEGSPTLTDRHLARHAWPAECCAKMAQEALEGEMALAEQSDSQGRLLRLLGLPVGAERTAAEQLARPATRAVGTRKPVRDRVGSHGSHP